MSDLKLYLLGPPRIERVREGARDGEPVHIPRRKVVALLAYLAVTGTPHSRDALATLLWPERDQSRARAYLRRALSELNRTLGEDFLVIDRETAALDPNASISLDVEAFRQLLAAAETHDHPATQVCSDCVTALEEAVELYDDDFMAGFTLRDSPAFDEWQFFEREALRGELAGVLERLARWHGSQGAYERAIAYVRRWVALDPLAEAAHRRLMALYAQSGQRNAALRQYAECERLLQEELGVSPEEETQALAQTFRVSEIPKVSAPRHNLPVQTTPFVGREAELAQIGELLNDPDCRLLTLVGPGGSGKTRLALEAAQARLDAHEDGMFFVSLAPLEGVDAIVPTVAESLGFQFYSGGTPQEQLLSYLRQKHLLLIMDNYEHLLEGAGLVSDIIHTAPAVKVLATSRARLNVGGEHRFHVGGMDYPDPALKKVAEAARHSAVELFTQSARRAQPGFQLTDDNLSGVVDACRLVEGMPLAIRLAAAWVEMLSPAGIAAEIRGGLDLLETERQDVPKRQRSMRAAFDHSWNLLSAREREIFQTLSVFRGPFSRHAAQQVARATLRELRRLVDRSLLYPVPEGMYEVHELLRQYAAEKLDQIPGAREAVRDRHCAHYTAALERWAADLKGPRSPVALTEIDGEIRNVRAAWRWAVERAQVEHLDRAIAGLCLYCDLRRRWQDAIVACQLASERLAGDTSHGTLRFRARLLAYQNWLAYDLGPDQLDSRSVAQATALLEMLESAGYDVRRERALCLWAAGEFEASQVLFQDLGDQWSTACLLASRAFIESMHAGDYTKGKSLMRESLALFQSAGDQTMLARILTNWGWTDWFYGELDEARQAWEQSLPTNRSVGDQWWEAVTLHSLGCAAGVSGDLGRAQNLLQAALALQRHLGDQRGIADSLHQLANVKVYQGQFDVAESLAQESVAIAQAIGYFNTIGETCRDLGIALIALGRYAEARTCLEEGVANHIKVGWKPLTPIDNLWLARAVLHLGRTDHARALGEADLDQARAIGLRREIGLLSLLLGDVALVAESYADAQAGLNNSVAVMQEIGFRPELGSVLASLGLAALGLGNTTQAREHTHSALRECIETRMVFPLLRVLAAAALLLADAGDTKWAVEVYALASRYPYVANSVWFEDVVGEHVAAAAADLPPDIVAAAQARGRERDLWETAEAVLNDLNR